LKIAPGLGRELDEELGMVGHLENTMGDLIARVVALLYELYEHLGREEFETFKRAYQQYVRPLCELDGYYCPTTVHVREGVAEITIWKLEWPANLTPYKHYKYSYYEFLEKFSPMAFLGLLVPRGSRTLWICCRLSYRYDTRTSGCTSYTEYIDKCLLGASLSIGHKC
jgi:hypothetical protein